SRREFLCQAAGGAVGALLGAHHWPAAAEAQGTRVTEKIPIVDTHQHLWDLEKFNLPWTKGNETLGRSFIMSDYLQATAGLNVTKAVYMEVDVHPAQQIKETEYVIDICERGDTPTVAAVISGRPNSAEFADYIRRFADSPY